MIRSSHPVRIVNHPNIVADAARSAFYLEIQKGRTRFPYRPVRTGRFLIGNGAGCDLRLGGSEVPPLHSIVHHEDGRFRLESVAASPELRVNDQPVRSTILEEGDLVRIGPIELVARFAFPEHEASAATRGATPRVVSVPEFDVCTDSTDPSLEHLSAEELVDLIDSEHAAVEEHEARRSLGSRALFDAALNRVRAEEPAEETQPRNGAVGSAELDILRRLEAALERLNRFAETLDTDAVDSATEAVAEPLATRGPRSAA